MSVLLSNVPGNLRNGLTDFDGTNSSRNRLLLFKKTINFFYEPQRRWRKKARASCGRQLVNDITLLPLPLILPGWVLLFYSSLSAVISAVTSLLIRSITVSSQKHQQYNRNIIYLWCSESVFCLNVFTSSPSCSSTSCHPESFLRHICVASSRHVSMKEH